MTISPSPIPNTFVSDNGTLLRMAVVDIGTWDMSTVFNLIVDVGVSHADILFVQLQIINDDGSQVNYVTSYKAGGVVAGSFYDIRCFWTNGETDTELVLSVVDGDGYSSTAGYTSTANSRGKISILYQV